MMSPGSWTCPQVISLPLDPLGSFLLAICHYSDQKTLAGYDDYE